MRRRTSAVGAALIIVALFLYYSPGTVSVLTSSLGPVTTETIYDRDSVIPILAQNYSYLKTNLITGDSLSVTIMSNPDYIDVLLLNQGNFSQWSLAGRGAYSTYPQSKLHVSNYSFVFANQEAAQNFFVVLVSHSTNSTTDVLAHATITRESTAGSYLFPALFGALGVVLLAYSLGGGSSKKKDTEIESARTENVVSQASAGPPGAGFCRHCGAALRPGSPFCPSCNRSQA